MLKITPPPASVGQFLTATEVTQRLKVGKSTLYRKIRNEGFPKPIQMGLRCARWSEDEIKNWISQQNEGKAA
ncbi:helix-turn-helix transcriptional regulator [Acetobacter cerevisiae]|uniref:helix-turn-helix transcriptional regulator n=1 Tax=Acetobacter cerevisiae TaxID=178900 RepID=UPI003414FB0B